LAAILRPRGGNADLRFLPSPSAWVSPRTLTCAEKGDPKVGLGVYAMALFVLGFGSPLGTLIDVSRDDTGLLLDEERLPKRVRMKKARGPQS